MNAQKTKKRPLAVVAAVMAALLLAGCSASAGNGYRDTSNEAAATEPYAPIPSYQTSDDAYGGEMYDADYDYPAEAPESAPAAGASGVAAAENYGEKLIKDVTISGETREFDEALAAINDSVAALGGYIETSSINGKKPQAYGDSGRTANIVARIPAEALEEFLSGTRAVVDVISEYTDIRNVTAEYYDAQGRKETYEIQLQRLEAILTEAAELSDIIALETEIARVRYEIEALETTLQGLDNKVSYSTVTIEFYELTQFERPAATQQGLGERMGSAFGQSLKDIGQGFQDALVWACGNWLLLVLLALVILAVILLIRRAKRLARAPQTLNVSTEALPQEQADKADDNHENKKE